MKRLISILLCLTMLSGLSVIMPAAAGAATQAESFVETARKEIGQKERSAYSDDIKYNDSAYGRRVYAEKRRYYFLQV